MSEYSQSQSTGRVILETERLFLRKFFSEDGPFILNLLTQPSFLEFIGDRGVHDIGSAKNYILQQQSQYREPGYGSYGVVLKKTGALIGMTGIKKRETLPHPDIGYAFLPHYWHKGYAFEGAQAMLNYSKTELGMEVVVAFTSPDNVASQKLLKKLGMTLKKSMRAKETDEVSLLFEPSKTHLQ